MKRRKLLALNRCTHSNHSLVHLSEEQKLLGQRQLHAAFTGMSCAARLPEDQKYLVLSNHSHQHAQALPEEQKLLE